MIRIVARVRGSHTLRSWVRQSDISVRSDFLGEGSGLQAFVGYAVTEIQYDLM